MLCVFVFESIEQIGRSYDEREKCIEPLATLANRRSNRGPTAITPTLNPRRTTVGSGAIQSHTVMIVSCAESPISA